MVTDALTRIGGLSIPEPRPEPSPRQIGYRNRVTYTLRRLGGRRVVAGFHGIPRKDRITEVDGECLLPEEPLNAVWRALRRAWGPGADRLPSGERELRLTLRSTDRGVLLSVVGGRDWSRGAEALVEAVPGLTGVWWQPSEGAPRLAAGGSALETAWLAGALEAGPFGFSQVNAGVGDAIGRIVNHALEPLDAGCTVIDAYSGAGRYALPLAARGLLVEGIEADEDAVRSARGRGLEGFVVHHGRVEELLPALLPVDALVLNPPRAGLEESIPPVLSELGPGLIVYVSCDPATLARDLSRMNGAYEVKALHVLDMFPHTQHVETVLLLHRSGAHPGDADERDAPALETE
jgi:23S rRNA (uracil1939-C5)-methyltransferase